MGGENQIDSSAGNRDPGSSPRGRGKPGELARRVGDAGLIPAWAGKTCRTSATASSRAAHPRVGGENAAVIWRNLVPHGSSPRGRGKQIKSLPYAEGIGLIPAWAGKTFHKSPSTRHNGAHPRVGGENRCWPQSWRPGGGSSPRGRGKQVGAHDRYIPSRLIPAWAGKTNTTGKENPNESAHPRVGGENHDLTIAIMVKAGLIPAWAGKTRGRAWFPFPVGAHPRVGGENSPSAVKDTAIVGSSPRGRGKRFVLPIE